MNQKVWLVCSQKGGVSKSTIAYGLAERLARSDTGHRVVLCDADHPQYTTKTLAALREQHGLGPLPFQIIACKDTGAVGRAAVGYEHVVIDGAPHASQDTVHFARHSDVIVLPTRTAVVDLAPNLDLARDLEARGVPRSKMVFVLTQSPNKTETMTARDLLISEGWAVLEQDLHFAASFSTAGDKGRTFTDVRHRGLRFKAETLLDELTKRG